MTKWSVDSRRPVSAAFASDEIRVDSSVGKISSRDEEATEQVQCGMPCIQIGDPYVEPLGEFRGRASREFAVRVEERSQIDHLARFLDRLPINDIHRLANSAKVVEGVQIDPFLIGKNLSQIGEYLDQWIELLANLQAIERPVPVHLTVITGEEMVRVLLAQLTGTLHASVVFGQSSHICNQIG